MSPLDTQLSFRFLHHLLQRPDIARGEREADAVDLAIIRVACERLGLIHVCSSDLRMYVLVPVLLLVKSLSLLC